MTVTPEPLDGAPGAGTGRHTIACMSLPESALDPTQPVLVVSPHLDDAILSAFALCRWERATVLNVFDGAPTPRHETTWDRLCGFADSDDAVSARHAENAAAFAGLDVPQLSVGLLDSQYLTAPRGLDEPERILTAVLDWVHTQGEPRCTVAVPAGAGRPAPAASIGGGAVSARKRAIRQAVGPFGGALLDARSRYIARHTKPAAQHDHLLVRDVVAGRLAARPDLDVVLYEEVPYLWGAPGDDQAGSLARRCGRVAQPVVIDVDRAEKARRIGSYRSQLAFLYAPHGPLDSTAGLPARERYWRLTAVGA